MELVLALVLFIALIAAWCVLPGSAISESTHVTSTEPVSMGATQQS